MAQSLAREFGPQGIHVAHVVVDGLIDTPGLREKMGEDKDEKVRPLHKRNMYRHPLIPLNSFRIVQLAHLVQRLNPDEIAEVGLGIRGAGRSCANV